MRTASRVRCWGDKGQRRKTSRREVMPPANGIYFEILPKGTGGHLDQVKP